MGPCEKGGSSHSQSAQLGRHTDSHRQPQAHTGTQTHRQTHRHVASNLNKEIANDVAVECPGDADNEIHEAQAEDHGLCRLCANDAPKRRQWGTKHDGGGHTPAIPNHVHSLQPGQ